MATVSKRTWTDGRGRQQEAWRVAYTDAKGKRRFVQKPTRREADAYRVKVEGELARGVHTADAASVTVAQAAEVWLAAAASTCDRGTCKSYGEIVRKHIVPLIGETKLSRLDSPSVAAFRDGLLATRSHAMTVKAVRHLSMILNDAQERGSVTQNVAQGVKVKRPRGEKQKLAKRADIPPIEHLKAMIEAADRLGNEDPRLPVMVRVVMAAGLRASELRGFAWPAADLRAAQPTLTVSQRADRWNEIGVPKSDAGTRIIPIGPALAAMLKEWKLRCPLSPLNLMFPGEAVGGKVKSGRWATRTAPAVLGPISQGRMAELLLKVQIAAELAIDTGKRDEAGEIIWKLRYDWHHLRHVAASNWLNDGIDLKRLQVWIGHANIALTIDVYGHLITDAKKDAALAAGAEAALFA